MERDKLPGGWETDRLGDLCDIVIGGTPRRQTHEYWGGSNRWACISDLNNGVLTETRERITDLGVENSNAKLIKTGTLLFSFKLTIGKMAFAGVDLYTNEAIAALPIKTADRIEPKFLYYALKVASVTKGAEEAAKGFTLNMGTLPLIKIAFPKTCDEQRRIVARIQELTSRVEKARYQQNEAIDEMASYLPNSYYSVYQKLLDEFDTIPLAQAGQIMGGGTPSKDNPLFWSKGIPWVSPKSMKSWWIEDSTDHITPEALQASAAKLIPSPAVLFVVRGMILARNVPVAVSTRPLAINQDMKAIVPKEGIEAEFLASMMRGAEKTLLGQVEVAGHGTRKLETERWGNLPIPVPPKPMQREIVRDLNLMQTKAQDLAQMQAEINAELASFTPALLAKAFRGEL